MTKTESEHIVSAIIQINKTGARQEYKNISENDWRVYYYLLSLSKFNDE